MGWVEGYEMTNVETFLSPRTECLRWNSPVGTFLPTHEKSLPDFKIRIYLIDSAWDLTSLIRLTPNSHRHLLHGGVSSPSTHDDAFPSRCVAWMIWRWRRHRHSFGGHGSTVNGENGDSQFGNKASFEDRNEFNVYLSNRKNTDDA